MAVVARNAHKNEDTVNTQQQTKPRAEWNYSPTFSQWLYSKLDSRSQIGDFARWVYDDRVEDEEGYTVSCWPHRSTTLSHMVVHLRDFHGSEKKAPTELDLRRAFTAYHEFAATGVGLPVRRGGVVASDRNAHRGYLIAKTTIEQIRELANWQGTTQGEVIERLVASAHGRWAAKQ